MNTGVLMEKLEPRSLIVTLDPENYLNLVNESEDNHKLTVLDFSLTRVRRQEPFGKDWREWQADKDENGAIGLAMHKG
jgi:hypothetical protein